MVVNDNGQVADVGLVFRVQRDVGIDVGSVDRSALDLAVSARQVASFQFVRLSGGLVPVVWVQVAARTGAVAVGGNSVLVDVVEEGPAAGGQVFQVDVHDDGAVCCGAELDRAADLLVELGDVFCACWRVSDLGGLIGTGNKAGGQDGSYLVNRDHFLDVCGLVVANCDYMRPYTEKLASDALVSSLSSP